MVDSRITHRIDSALIGRLQLVVPDTGVGGNDSNERIIDLGEIEIPFSLEISPDMRSK